MRVRSDIDPMNKTFRFGLALPSAIVLGLLLASCATLNKEQVARVENAALLTVTCDRRIDTSDFYGLAALANQLAQNEQFRLKPIAVKLRDDIFQRYAQGFPFTLLAEQAVIGSSAYRSLAAEEFEFNRLFYETPDGYSALPLGDEEAFARIVAAFPDVQAFMSCSAYFKLTKMFQIIGFGTARVDAFVTIAAYDRDRKVILRKTSYGSSAGSIKFALGGVFDATLIQPLCVQAADQAALEFDRWFTKNK
jgi:hypothetical protein